MSILNQSLLSSYARVPNAPTAVSASAIDSSSASISFTAPTNNGGRVITSYTAVSSPGNITATISQAGSGSITVTGLTGNTTYTFIVYASNAIGNSINSSSSNPVTIQPQAVTYNAWAAAIGGGGGGAASTTLAGGGGGGGGVNTCQFTTTPGTQFNITIGAGGTAGQGNNWNVSPTPAFGIDATSGNSSGIYEVSPQPTTISVSASGGGKAGGRWRSGSSGVCALNTNSSSTGGSGGASGGGGGSSRCLATSPASQPVGLGAAGNGGGIAGNGYYLNGGGAGGGGGGAGGPGGIGYSYASPATTACRSGNGGGDGGAGCSLTEPYSGYYYGNGYGGGGGGGYMVQAPTADARTNKGRSLGGGNGGGAGGYAVHCAAPSNSTLSSASGDSGVATMGGGGGGGVSAAYPSPCQGLGLQQGYIGSIEGPLAYCYGRRSGNGGSGTVFFSYPSEMPDLSYVAPTLGYWYQCTGGRKIYQFCSGTGSITI